MFELFRKFMFKELKDVGNKIQDNRKQNIILAENNYSINLKMYNLVNNITSKDN